MAKAGHGQSTQPSRMRAGRGGNKATYDPSGNHSQSHSDDHGIKSKRRHKQWPYWAFVVGMGECFRTFSVVAGTGEASRGRINAIQTPVCTSI